MAGTAARGRAMSSHQLQISGDGFDLRRQEAPASLEPAVVLLQAQHVLNQDIVAA